MRYSAGEQKVQKGTQSEKGNIDRRMGYALEPDYRCDEDEVIRRLITCYR
jgi:hypothetical protein